MLLIWYRDAEIYVNLLVKINPDLTLKLLQLEKLNLRMGTCFHFKN